MQINTAFDNANALKTSILPASDTPCNLQILKMFFVCSDEVNKVVLISKLFIVTYLKS